MQYHKHHYNFVKLNAIGCDLLEKSYFCSITNINSTLAVTLRLVVICLKNRTFAVSQTSCKPLRHLNARCDLLEKSYFCSITNIIVYKFSIMKTVVICLKNRTFAVSQTSVLNKCQSQWRCDLLEKSYFCIITNIVCGIGISMKEVVICLKNRTFAVSQTSCPPAGVSSAAL